MKPQNDQQPSAPESVPVAVPTNPYFAAEPVATQATGEQPLPDASVPILQGQGLHTPPPKSKKKLLFIIAGVVLLLLVAAVLFFVINRSSTSDNSNAPYTFTKPILDVASDREFSFDVSYDPRKLESYVGTKDNQTMDPMNPYSSAIGVFTDKSFEHPVPNVYFRYDITDDQLTLKPLPTEIGAEQLTLEDKTVKVPGVGWGLYDEYYIVQKLDKKGEKLDKPIVTKFTAKKETSLETPAVNYAVTNEGAAQLSWPKVAGATKYYIVRTVNNRQGIIGTTTDLKWVSSDQDKQLKEDIADGFNITIQNTALENFPANRDQDAAHTSSGYAGYLTDEATKPIPTQYGVIAANDSADYSAYGWFDGSDIESLLPYSIAMNARKEMGADPSTDETFDSIPTQLPVTAANGVTVLRPAIIKTAETTKTVITVAEVDSANATVKGSHKETVVSVKVGIEGTLITSTYSIRSYDEATYMSEVNRIAQRNLDARTKTGLATYGYATDAADIGDVTPVSTAPSTKYPVNGTSAFVTYMAKQLIAGTEYIDVSAYVDYSAGNNTPGPYDALEEAIYQNAYVVGVKDYHYYQKQGIMQVSYAVGKDERTKAQQETFAAVEKLKGTIVKSGMSDREKALAINNYLTGSATYDDDAFNRRNPLYDDKPMAHSAFSILVSKTGVCDGYSLAFKVLADAVGVDSIVVTGRLKDSIIGHAWNKVYMDNKWQNIDVTFNDDDTGKNEIFGVSDKQLDRIEHTSFMDDALIKNYAAK